MRINKKETYFNWTKEAHLFMRMNKIETNSKNMFNTIKIRHNSQVRNK